ncbi:MAG: selenocysteine-specific translation elongation factor [Candidatus Lernaella stagnicola]|nr:selenocysteine-specific translation elongation factor [Candidatus Lernaella stagnicola]
MNRRLVMGTAGHIDHGKTSLIKLLTGTDCDRLPEEKARGITIELGFTHLALPSGGDLGVVDVPGHERFVRNMVAGAGGIDFVVLVVAADEAVMPQTREHLAICRLLGIRYGLIAMTKLDLVDQDMLELAEQDVRDFVAGSFLEDAPIVPVSTVTGQGRDDLLRVIEQTAAQVTGRSESGIFRLPIDRVFTMKGFGTVVTGTTIGGRVGVGDEVEILPSGRRTRVRGLQVHGHAVEQTLAGRRTAVNLQGIDVSEAPRGDVLAPPDLLSPSWMLDVEIEMLDDAPRPLKRRSLVRVHCFTREVMARVVPMSADEILPGQSGLAQLRLTEPLLALPGDRFVMRSYSPITTIGGGVILSSQPRKHRAPFTKALADLQALSSEDIAEKMRVHYRLTGRAGIELRRLAPMLGVGEKLLRPHYQKMLSQQHLVRIDPDTERAVDAEAFAEIQGDLLTMLKRFHKERPTEPGISRAQWLSAKPKGAVPKVMEKVASVLLAAEKVVQEDGIVRLLDHSVTADEQLQAILDDLFAYATGCGLSAPTHKEMLERAGDKKLGEEAIGMLLRDGRLERLGGELFFASDALREAEEKLVAYLEENEEINAQGYKTLFDLTRKWVIPLAEYFDARRVTLRVGDRRVLRKRR